MITTIQRIHHKSFDSYEMGEIRFSRINLIYGLNGMGKSSFRDFLVKGIGDDSTNTEHSKEAYKVFSYDEDYKRDTLCIYDDKKGNSLESFYLGEKIREIIKAKEMVNENIEKAKLKKQNQEEQLKKANNRKDTLRQDIARETRGILEKIDSNSYKTPQSYTKNNINDNDFEKAKMLSGDELKAAQLHTVNKKPNKIELPDFSKIKELLKGIVIFEGMLKQTPKNEAIEKFKQDVELENFAKIAINIKTKNPDKYNRVCPLCEQEISAIGLWENLEKHFNQEYHQFIERLKKAKEFFAVASRELIEFRNWLNRNFISENLIYDREAINIDQLRQDYLGSIEFVEDSIGVACNALDDKMKAPNESGILLDIDKENLKKHFTKITSDEIKETVDLHNKQQLQYEAIIKQNIEKIQQHFIAKNRANFLAIQNDININQNRIKKYTLYSSCCKKKIDELDSKMKELDASFKSLNEDLHKYFNLQEIRFEKISDSHYKTQRKDCKGNWFDCKSGLSEGEKTIISVIYFVNHCFSVLGQQQKAYPIFILDDPITSLDDNKGDLIKNYIVQKIIGSKERQIFILSHDKDFLARIRKELHSQYRKDMKFFEIIKKDKLQSSFKNLEKLKSEKELREFYNRLKEGIGGNEMLQEDDLRKFLEGLMAIIFENYSNFTDGYKRLLECLGIKARYSSSDIQKLNHNLDDRGYSADELRDKAKFVVQIFEKMIEKIQAKNFIVSS